MVETKKFSANDFVYTIYITKIGGAPEIRTLLKNLIANQVATPSSPAPHLMEITMKTITQVCQECKSFFQAQLREVNRGNAKYCSKKCSASGVKKKLLAGGIISRKHNVECAYCKKTFYKNESQIKNSKTNTHFCCREHKDIGQRIETGIKQIQPSHYGETNKKYREIAFRHKEKTCERCHYNKFPEILEVHHKDRNRENNSIENLEIVCPTCHMEEHFKNNDGKWKTRII